MGSKKFPRKWELRECKFDDSHINSHFLNLSHNMGKDLHFPFCGLDNLWIPILSFPMWVPKLFNYRIWYLKFGIN